VTTLVNSRYFVPSRWHWFCTLQKIAGQGFLEGGDMPETALITLLLAGSLLTAAPAHTGVNVDVNVAPQTLASAPRLVALPGSSVFHAPHEAYTLLAYAGRYYSLRHGAWFRSTGPGNSWNLIAADRVPNAVLAVLPTFAKAPALSFAATATPAR
jgi:hypothetical protein